MTHPPLFSTESTVSADGSMPLRCDSVNPPKQIRRDGDGQTIELAEKFGIGLCSIMRTSHAGAIGYFAERATVSGKICIVMSASKPLMIYHGSNKEGVSTNPIAIGLPTSNPSRPIVLDMSTAAVAFGKIMAAKDAGKTTPEGWDVDEHGSSTTDPAKVKAVLPMSGPKGSGLSLMIEILVSVLGSNPLIATALTEGRDAGFNGMVIAIDPTFFPVMDLARDATRRSEQPSVP